MTQALNRTQRRTLEKRQRKVSAMPMPRIIKEGQRIAQKQRLSSMALLRDCTPYKPEEIAHDMLRIRAAFERLQDGTADDEDFNRVSVAIGLATIRATEISEDLESELRKAHHTLRDCYTRCQKHGRFGFDGPGLLLMRWAIDAHEEILSNSSHRQMELAMQDMHRIMHTNPKATVPLIIDEQTGQLP
jgi:hypothetical protein